MNRLLHPSAFGMHRVLEPLGALPQNAWRLDPTPVVAPNEILCDVEALNIDSASFRQIAEANDHDPRQVAEHVIALVAERGKHHNSVTGSGGMFVGRVREIGADLLDRGDLHVGDHIASLVSLTLTPLAIEKIERIDMASGRIWVRGTAIIFESGIYATLPDDLPGDVTLAVLDVAGAPAQVLRLVRPGDSVAVLGADGKSGILACVAAREAAGPEGRIVGFAPDATTVGATVLRDGGYVNDFEAVDARDAVAVLGVVPQALPRLADVTINCVNVPGTELTSVLLTRDEGTVYFFSMCTSFTAAALGAEGIGKDVTMIVGNGYAKGHAATSIGLLRRHPTIRDYFLTRYGGATTVPPHVPKSV